MKYCLQLILAIFAITLSAPASAGADIQVNRYSFQKQTPPPHQADLLSAVIETRFPNNVVTVGHAIEYMLERSGYQFIYTEESAEAMTLELPAVHRNLGPLNLRTALTTVAGPAWRLQENNEHRKVWFEPKVAAANTPNPTSPPVATPPREARSTASATAPRQASHSSAAVASTWLLDPDKTLRANLDEWASQAGWSLQWDALHDYEIDFPASYDGTFRMAVESALEHYRTAPVPLTASFFNGNAVLLIQPASAVP